MTRLYQFSRQNLLKSDVAATVCCGQRIQYLKGHREAFWQSKANVICLKGQNDYYITIRNNNQYGLASLELIERVLTVSPMAEWAKPSGSIVSCYKGRQFNPSKEPVSKNRNIKSWGFKGKLKIHKYKVKKINVTGFS